ncbi:cupin domain-containing protein [Oscillospiraceae bacterium OttesenSCG-928-F05]|nr:cupin domain-containing protein [Oscillospiraceae bacterium OttesenSCG-928-F05]
MTEQLKEIGIRLAALRDICGFTPEEMAEKLDMSVEDYLAYERGERDFSFSFLYNAAGVLGVDVLDIMSGESPKLSTCTVVRSGGGYDIQRRKAYEYKHLAFTFRKKKAEPFMVTVEPRQSETQPALHDHPGQEFNYMVEGRMEFFIGAMTYVLETGDSVYFDSGVPHAMRALDGKRARFLAVVMK